MCPYVPLFMDDSVKRVSGSRSCLGNLLISLPLLYKARNSKGLFQCFDKVEYTYQYDHMRSIML